MLGAVITAVLVAAFLFIGYLMLKAYKPSWFKKASAPTIVHSAPTPIEPFVATAPPKENPLNTPPPPVPAAAPPVKQDPPQKEREITPGGPNPPNMRAPQEAPRMSPEVMPTDPYQDNTMEAPIEDSMRHPELSFGPGVSNEGMNKLGLSGTGGSKALASESPFSPEFAQNGGSFMGTVFANDLSHDDTFATA